VVAASPFPEALEAVAQELIAMAAGIRIYTGSDATFAALKSAQV
jgi:hypothetical protein